MIGFFTPSHKAAIISVFGAKANSNIASPDTVTVPSSSSSTWSVPRTLAGIGPFVGGSWHLAGFDTGWSPSLDSHRASPVDLVQAAILWGSVHLHSLACPIHAADANGNHSMARFA